MASPKAKMSFSQSRKAMLKQISAIKNKNTQKVTIRFQNDDVPNFLKKLDDFENESSKTCLIAK